MKQIRFSFALPTIHLGLALVLFFYGSYQYRALLRETKGVSLDFTLQNYPAPAQRIAYGLSFPAFVLSNASIIADHAGFHKKLFEWSIEGKPFTFRVLEAVFFSGVVLFWFWIGFVLDRRIGILREPAVERARLRTVVVLGLNLTVICMVGYFAIAAVNDYRRPIGQIGVFGLAWALMLFIDFVRSLIRSRKRGALAST